MSILTQISKKVNYDISKALNDPEAEAYAKQQEIQAKQDAEAKERKLKEEERIKKDLDMKAKSDAKAKSLAERSTFSIKRAMRNTASGILTGFMSLILICFILYGGHLAANDAIGYNNPFRILSFIYGCIFFFIEIPKSFIRKYWYKLEIPYYTYLPLSTYQPTGDLETIFLGGFCYREDEASNAARSVVGGLYKTAFDKTQIKGA
jgi:hypothetical protein